MHKPHLAESYHKELLATLQAKGKIPRMMTAADERRDAENKNTGPRIFPGPWGTEAVLENMVRKAEERIEQATRGQPAAGGTAARAAAAAAGAAGRPHRDPSARKQIQARMSQLEQELAAERALRAGLEGQMAGLRESLSRGGGGGGGGGGEAGGR